MAGDQWLWWGDKQSLSIALQVEAPVARLLELDKLAATQAVYTPSRNRQWHMYNCTERKDLRSPALRRTFLRGLVRQLGSPAMLAATYSGNTEKVASAAVDELEEALVGIWQQQLTVLGGKQAHCFCGLI